MKKIIHVTMTIIICMIVSVNVLNAECGNGHSPCPYGGYTYRTLDPTPDTKQESLWITLQIIAVLGMPVIAWFVFCVISDEKSQIYKEHSITFEKPFANGCKRIVVIQIIIFLSILIYDWKVNMSFTDILPVIGKSGLWSYIHFGILFIPGFNLIFFVNEI